MSARKIDGEAAARVERRSRPPRAASRQPDRSQVQTPAQATGRRTPLAFHLQAKTTGLSTPLALCYLPLAGARHWPTPEVKACIPSAAAEPSPRRRTTDPGIPPDLLNPPKGFSMAKTARVSLQLARKFVPVAELPKGAQLPQSRTRETMIQSGYTLCEAHDVSEYSS